MSFLREANDALLMFLKGKTSVPVRIGWVDQEFTPPLITITPVDSYKTDTLKSGTVTVSGSSANIVDVIAEYALRMQADVWTKTSAEADDYAGDLIKALEGERIWATQSAFKVLEVSAMKGLSREGKMWRETFEFVVAVDLTESSTADIVETIESDILTM